MKGSSVYGGGVRRAAGEVVRSDFRGISVCGSELGALVGTAGFSLPHVRYTVCFELIDCII
jgi:hypothetical protein